MTDTLTKSQLKQLATVNPDGRPPVEQLVKTEWDVIGDSRKAGVQKVIRRDQTPLDRYFARGEIDQRLYDAGCKLRNLYYVGYGVPQTILNYSRFIVQSSGGDRAEASDRRLEAQENFFVALNCGGDKTAQVLLDVTLNEFFSEEIAKRQEFNPRSGLAMVSLALDGLASFWKL